MIYGEVTQLSLWLWPRQLKHWPRHQAEKWGLVSVWIICPDFLWEELWDLENTAYSLPVAITAGAMIFCYF